MPGLKLSKRRKQCKNVVRMKHLFNRYLYAGETPYEIHKSFMAFYRNLNKSRDDYWLDYIWYAKTKPENRWKIELDLIQSSHPPTNEFSNDACSSRKRHSKPDCRNTKAPMTEYEECNTKKRSTVVDFDEITNSFSDLNDILSQMRSADIRRMRKNPDETIKLLSKHGLIVNNRDCSNCCIPMRLYERSDVVDRKHWMCHKCRSSIGLRRGSFFERIKIPLWKVIELAYCWANNLRVDYSSWECNVDDSTTIDYFNFFRLLCTAYTEDVVSNVQIGGPGTVVEIDESCFSKRKHNRGRITAQIWVFGGVERGNSKNFFAVRVKKRNAQTLIPLIKKYIAPGTVIISDMWRAYLELDHTLSHMYIHGAVNHSKNFVCPDNKYIHTQTIESMWNKAKKKLRENMGTSPAKFNSYLSESIFRQQHRNQSVFANICFYMGVYLNPG